MKKKISLFILFILCLIPVVVSAGGTCESDSCNNAGGGSGNSGGNYDGTCDNVYRCTSVHRGGVRLTLYVYDGSGTPTKIGASVDLWTDNSLGSGIWNVDYVTSPVSSDVLKARKSGSCSVGNYSYMDIGDYKKAATAGKFNYYIMNSDASDTWYNGGISDYIYKVSDGSGWLKTRFIDYLANSDYDSAAKLFKTDGDTIKNNIGNMYVTAEVIVVFAYNYKPTWIAGTVSELSTYKISSDTTGHLCTTDTDLSDTSKTTTGTIGNLIGKSGSSYYLKAFNSKSCSTPSSSSGFCGTTYGLTAWYIPDCCPDCGKPPACDDEDACGNITNGTAERRACAINWCNANDKDNSSCVSDCSKVTPDEGCDTTPGVCSTKKTTTTGGDVCSADANVVIESNVCYDDSTSTSELNDGLSVDLSKYVENMNIKYYRIDCTEKATLSDTANAQTLLLTTSGTTNMYLGYTLGFYKTCTLTFKSTDGSSWVKDDYNKNPSSASEVSSYSGKMKIIEDIIFYYHYCDSSNKHNCSQDIKTEMQDYANALLKIYKNAKSRLNYVVKTDYDSGTTNQATIDIINSDMTSKSTVTVDLKPVYCKSNTKESESTTIFSGDVCYNGQSEITTFKSSSTSTTCSGTSINTVTTNNSGTEKTYSYTYYFSLPSSYISYSDNKIFYKSSDCSTEVSSNGFCVEVENAYAFAPFTSTVSTGRITSGEYTIAFSKLGTCKLSYNYTCDYNLEDSSYCNDELAKYDYDTDPDGWQNAFDKYCSCDVYCGSNVACRAKYCPDECDECDDLCSDDDPSCYKIKYCTLKDCDECGDKCDQQTSTKEEYYTCYFNNCCTAKCEGNVGCINNCCVTECGCLYDSSSTEYKTCVTACGCPEGGCPEGEDYYYRSIDMDNPFPDGVGKTRTPGYNWYNKVELITDSDNVNSSNYDATDGKNTNIYEYAISLSSSDIKDIKEKSGYSTTYIDPIYSTKANSSISDKVYCSEFLHEYLASIGVSVEVGSQNNGKGCEL